MRQKRFLSWIMVFTLLVGMFSFPAYAEGNTTTTTISGDGTAEKTGTMTVTLVIPKKTPAATDLTYTAPTELTYSGSDKAATVAAKDGVTGMGEITVKYYSDAARTTEATPKNVGTYYVGATVAEGDEYAASTAVLYGDGWMFEITKSTPTAPAAPTKASATKNSITLNAASGCEYSKDSANWQSGTEFTGLLPGTEYTFYQRVKATANTNASAASSASFSTEADTYAMTITLTIKEMEVSAENVSVAYDGQSHGITVNVTDPNSGYTVKYGTVEGTYDLDASPTQTEVGTQTVYYQVTANNYVTKTGSATVTISEASAVAATVTANHRTYDGTDKPLVNVDDSTLVGGEMQYALGENATTAPAENLYTTSIPTKTDAGTYYVWYKVVGDTNHSDSEVACVEVTINPRPSSGGGGGSSVASYDIVVADGITGGTVKPDRTNVGVGTRVTVTVTPDTGYKLDKLTATDKNDKDVALTQGDNGTYTFTMPNSKVTLSATYVSDGSQPTPTPPAPSDSEKFVDVPKDAWYHDAVYWAVDKGITEGTDETHFSPNASCTRAQMVTFLWRAAGEPTPANNVNPFTDVDGDAYYYNAVLWGVDKGIVKGTSETTFSPNATVTRAQTVAFLYRYEQSKGGGFTGAWAFPLDYSDAADVPDWAYEAFCWMTMHNVVQGSDGKLLPNDKCLRSQIVTMLDRYCNAAEA